MLHSLIITINKLKFYAKIYVMKNKRLKRYIVAFALFLLILVFAHVLIIVFTVSYNIKADNYKAISLINDGKWEVEKKFIEFGTYSHPVESSAKLTELGYWGEFELINEISYIYGTNLISLNPFLDPYFCINEKGESGFFDHYKCGL